MVMAAGDLAGTAQATGQAAPGVPKRKDFRPVGAGTSAGNVSGGANLGGVSAGGDVPVEPAQSGSAGVPIAAPPVNTAPAPPPVQTPTSTRVPAGGQRQGPQGPVAPVEGAAPVPVGASGISEIDPAARLGVGVADEGPRTFARPGTRSFNPFLGRAIGADLSQAGAAQRFGVVQGDIGRRNALGASAGANVGGGGGFAGEGSPEAGDPLNSLLASKLLG